MTGSSHVWLPPPVGRGVPRGSDQDGACHVVLRMTWKSPLLEAASGIVPHLFTLRSPPPYRPRFGQGGEATREPCTLPDRESTFRQSGFVGLEARTDLFLDQTEARLHFLCFRLLRIQKADWDILARRERAVCETRFPRCVA